MRGPEDWDGDEMKAFFTKALAKEEVSARELSIGLRLLHKRVIEAEQLLREVRRKKLH
jgi:hypothetical protein